MCKAKVDRDAARFFFGQPVGVGPGQRFDQRGFAMVDVSGGGKNKVLLGHS